MNDFQKKKNREDHSGEDEFPYLHGFSTTEQQRLLYQSKLTEHVIYQTINFSEISHLLEVGCGVGAQSEILLRRFPNIKKLTGIDLSEQQLTTCRDYLNHIPYASDRFEILKMDAGHMDFSANSFDGAFLCWVLEHVPSPSHVLSEVRRVLRPGSSIVINEVMNSTFFLDPYSPNLWQYWMAFNDYQTKAGGDPFIGLKLGNLLQSIGFRDIKTEFKIWHFDNRHPEKRREHIKFWQELLLGAEEKLIAEKFVSKEVVSEMKRELKLVEKDPNAVFYYSFMQARAKVY